MNRFVILGGSSPFTAGLVEAIRAREAAVPPHTLVLFGRSESGLEIVAQHARLRLGPLGWQVESSREVRAALAGAHIVLHQIRYGGTDGRQADEALAFELGLIPDETLGPAALHSAFRLKSGVEATSQVILDECPGTWVLNLTNPLSVTTFLLTRAGLTRCVGLCELPRVTAMKASALLDLDWTRVRWSYTGLNHRGFITRLSWKDTDKILEVATALGEATLDGITSTDITALGAIPTKYFRLLRDAVPSPGPSRAAILERLRTTILDELAEHPEEVPPSLSQRSVDWYSHAVVPFVEAISGNEPILLEVNRLGESGLVEEGRAFVNRSGIRAQHGDETSMAVHGWIERFRNHERLVLEAVGHPSLLSIQQALGEDPLVPLSKVDAAARRIWANVKAEGA